jgi:glycosyltransferase involved in cell wall biosynthesis
MVRWSGRLELARESVFFIEPYAHERNGHSPANLLALAAAATAEGLQPVVIVLSRSLPPDLHRDLPDAGAMIVNSTGVRGGAARALHLMSRLLRGIVERVNRGGPPTRLSQVWIFARAFAEAAAVRTARFYRNDGVIVILTSNDCLLGFSGYLGRHSHIRVVHKVHHRVGVLAQAVERMCSRGRALARVWCPTEAVAHDVRRRYPDVLPTVRTFAVVEPGQRITTDERVAARRRLGLAADDVVAVVVGGWQSHKDPLTALEGLARARIRLVVVVAGCPIDVDRALALQTNSCRVLPIVGPLDRETVREVYAAANFAVVSRVPGTATESGLVMDAAKYGVPLVISDHDPDLVVRLADADWVAVFRAGNPSSVASVVDAVACSLQYPGVDAPERLGMLTSVDMVRAFRAVVAAGDAVPPPPL